jgi:hypothetical protein
MIPIVVELTGAAPRRRRRRRRSSSSLRPCCDAARAVVATAAAVAVPRASTWLFRLALLLSSRPWMARANNNSMGGSGSSGSGSGSSSSYSEQVITNDLPSQMISGTCIASEPQRDCGLHKWETLSCAQVLTSYEFDLYSTCCSFQDDDASAGTPAGCVLTVGGPGNMCTWREPGPSNRYFTVMIMDQSTSTCPPTQYEIPKRQAPTKAPTELALTAPSSVPSSIDTSYSLSDFPSSVPSVPTSSNSSPPATEGYVPLAPIPSPAAAAPEDRSRAPTSRKPTSRHPPETTTSTETREPSSRSPTQSPNTPIPYSATGEGATDKDDDELEIPEAPIPSPAGPTSTTMRTARPTLVRARFPSMSPTEPNLEQQQMTQRSSGSCWATDPTLECGRLELPSLTCTDLLQAYEWSGTCCSFHDENDGRGCSLTVDGPKAHCTWRQKRDGGDEYTMYISERSTAVCPPSRYTIPVGAQVDGWDGPTPAPERSTGSCWTTSPNEECGYYTWSDPCHEVAEAYQWEGTCCSLADTESGGCRLTVDGPGSQCTFVDATSEYTIFVSEESDGSCPESSYEVGFAADTDTTTTYQSPTPEPVTSGYCSTTYPDESCGMYGWSESCESLLSQYEFTGTCCSLKGTETGGCRLVVDGPGSTCTWKEKEKESYFSVEIDDTNDRACPESTVPALSNATPSSPFTECVAKAFADCLTTCRRHPTLRQSFKACTRFDPTEAVQCAAGAADVCSETEGKAPMFLCQQLSNMVASGALHAAPCLSLQGKCAGQDSVCP